MPLHWQPSQDGLKAWTENADYFVRFNHPNWTASFCVHPDYGEHIIWQGIHLDICLSVCENRENTASSEKELLNNWSLDTSRTD